MSKREDYSKSENIFLQYYITLNCNLDCIACSSFSPLVEESTHVSLEYIKVDFEKIYKLTQNGNKITMLVLMGGEPLLHPQLNQIIQHFCDLGIRLRIVTNGLLIPKMNKEFFDLVKKYRINIKISIYKTIKYEKIFKILDKNGIRYGFYDQKGRFGHQYLSNEKKEISYCWYRDNVYILKNNKIYTCSETAFFDKFDLYFKDKHNIKTSRKDYIDLNNVDSLEELKKLRLKNIPELCSYCYGSEKKWTDWSLSKKSIDEWLKISPIKL